MTNARSVWGQPFILVSSAPSPGLIEPAATASATALIAAIPSAAVFPMLGSSNAIARSNSPHFPDRTELWINNDPHKRVRATVVFDNPGISLKARHLTSSRQCAGPFLFT
ncbi:MAG: hypothetical protein ACXW3X_18090 [Rhodoplanes sp.]